MKNYRIVPGLTIEKKENRITLYNDFKGVCVYYDDLDVLCLLDEFHQVETKEELLNMHPNKEMQDAIHEFFECGIFEKKNSFIKNMNNESCYRIFVFNENQNNSTLWKFTNLIIMVGSIPCLLLGFFLSYNNILDLMNHFSLNYLISLIVGFLPFCFLHEFGHCISAIANKAVVYDLGYYSKGINVGFYVFYGKAKHKKGNIQIALGGILLCFLICGILLIINSNLNNNYLLVMSLFYFFFNFTNLLIFQGFDGYNAINFYLGIENIESKIKRLIKHPFTTKYSKSDKKGCMILLLSRLFSILLICLFYILCLYAGLVYSGYI